MCSGLKFKFPSLFFFFSGFEFLVERVSYSGTISQSHGGGDQVF